MTVNHPYILPGYALMEIPQCEINWLGLPEPAKPKFHKKLISLVRKEDRRKNSVLQTSTSLLILDAEVTSNIVNPTNILDITPELSAQNDNQNLNDPFSSSVIAKQDREKQMRSIVPITATFISIAMCVGIYANGTNGTDKKSIVQVTRSNASAKQIPIKNGIPQNIANELDVYYHAQPDKTDRVVIEADSSGCEWKIAFNNSVNIPKGRYPALNEKNIQKCRDVTLASRPKVMRVLPGQEPKGKAGTNIAIVNIVDPATGLTDKDAFASYGNKQSTEIVDKATINAIIKSEIARVKKTASIVTSSSPVVDKPKIQNSRYPGIEYRNRPTTVMPSMPGNTVSVGDDRPTYIPYIPGMPYTAPESLNKPSQLRSIKPKVSGGIVKKEMVNQMQSARPSGAPTVLMQMSSQSARDFPLGANGIPSGNPVLNK